MSFETRETSRTLGKPINLLLFRWAAHADAVSGYTDADRAVSFQPPDFEQPITFEPVQIEVPAIRSSGSPDRARIEFSLPKDVPVAELYRLHPPSYVTTLRVFQGHQDDPSNEFLVTWAGRVLGVRLETPKAIFTCDPVSSALSRVGLRRPYQLGCPHVLYGPHCKANIVAATTAATMEAGDIAASSLAVPDGVLGGTTGVDPQKYFGGIARWCAERGEVLRTIIGVEEAGVEIILHLSGPTTGLEVGMVVDFTLGCNHRMDDCLNLHDNIHNHGGFPLIPTENPIGTQRNVFY